MDTVPPYSAVHTTPIANMYEDIIEFQACLLHQLWIVAIVRSDLAFEKTEFDWLCKHIGTDVETFPPMGHHKNVLESKHGIIRWIYVRLYSESSDSNTQLLVCQAAAFPNDLYGTDTFPERKLSKGYTKPLSPDILSINYKMMFVTVMTSILPNAS